MRYLFILVVFCLVLTHCGPSDEASEAETAKAETAKAETAKKATMAETKAVTSFSGVYKGLLDSADVKIYILHSVASTEGHLEQVLVRIDVGEEKLCTHLNNVTVVTRADTLWKDVSASVGDTQNVGYIGTDKSVSISFSQDQDNESTAWGVRLKPSWASVKNLTKTEENVPSFDELKKNCGF